MTEKPKYEIVTVGETSAIVVCVDEQGMHAMHKQPLDYETAQWLHDDLTSDDSMPAEGLIDLGKLYAKAGRFLPVLNYNRTAKSNALALAMVELDTAQELETALCNAVLPF